ncbi:PREDICTED: nicotianamine synthase-like [Tarenaya hassleriana]|uniref:nicotianamine synthase-like n=1 Tax=Tarenaya hassleriana TaxID=28532 RepID=UPI00053C7A61|nr:PREDICTED: nicotianamine synthase-like [Tarenaya hassleriana]
MEQRILSDNGVLRSKKVAFVGSGPMPLTSFVMATRRMTTTHFDNFDIDPTANELARKIAASDHALEERMKFLTRDVMELKEEFAEYDCVFMAALVGMSGEEKAKIIGHIRKYMKKGGYLLVRSAKGARAFLYPVVEEAHLLGFQVISVFHPMDDVINCHPCSQTFCLIPRV